MQPLRGVIFDLDGVLIDTSRFHKETWFMLSREEDLAFSDDFFYKTFGMQNYQIIPMMTDRKLTTEEISRMSDRKELLFRNLIEGKLNLLAGAEALISDLKDKGFRLSIGSSTTKLNMDFIRKNLPILNRFDAFVVDKDVTNGKPAPDTFLKAAERLSLQPKYCVVVEDAVQGVQAGKAAGMSVIAVTTTRQRNDLMEADLIVDSLDELNSDNFIRLLEGQQSI
ncbi:MAG: HAD family hydrolase [Anaerohalosphaeraceae bacterium]|jgi:beta-phosphoglucomutase